MNLIQIFKRFPTHEACLEHLEAVRWKGTPRCPYCNSTRVSPLKKEHRHHCNACNTSFSVTVGTIFHRTRLDLQKWFLAISLVLDARKGLSARQLARHLEVNKDTGWRMGMQIRKAMSEAAQRDLLAGVVEMDESYIGGKHRPGSGPRPKRGRGSQNKTPVVGMRERGGRIRARVTKDAKQRTLETLVRENIDTKNTVLMTDQWSGYLHMSRMVDHRVVNHNDWYVTPDGISTNSVETFWSLLKRGIVGQYHKVSIRYLPAYLDEFTYRFNHRESTDLFGKTLSRCMGA